MMVVVEAVIKVNVYSLASQTRVWQGCVMVGNSKGWLHADQYATFQSNK